MARLRSQGGYLSYIGMIAALVIVAILAATSLDQFGFGGGSSGGASGATNDSAAQAEVQHAFAALQACAQAQGGSFQGCGVDQVIENEPTLTGARNRINVAASAGSVSVSVASSSKNVFTIAADRGVAIRTCRTLGKGACPVSGRW